MSKTEKRIIGAILMVLLVAGSVADLTISKWLYQPDTWFTSFFARVGMLPCYGIAGFSFAVLWFTRTKDNRRKNLTGGILYLLFVVYCGFISSLTIMPEAKLLYTLVFTCVAMLLGYLVREQNRKQLRYFAVVSLITAFVEFYLIQIVKLLWGRQRFYSILDDFSLFKPWYAPLGKVLDDTYKSFPSGHSGDAAVLLCLLNLPLLVTAAKGKQKIWGRALIYGWIICVMLSRVMAGAHYVTDVTIGAGITYVIFLLADGYMTKRQNAKAEVQKEA